MNEIVFDDSYAEVVVAEGEEGLILAIEIVKGESAQVEMTPADMLQMGYKLIGLAIKRGALVVND